MNHHGLEIHANASCYRCQVISKKADTPELYLLMFLVGFPSHGVLMQATLHDN